MKNYCEQFVLCLAFTLMLIKGDISAMVGLYGDSIHFSGTISLIQINIKVWSNWYLNVLNSFADLRWLFVLFQWGYPCFKSLSETSQMKYKSFNPAVTGTSIN